MRFFKFKLKQSPIFISKMHFKHRYVYIARNAKDVCTNFFYDQCLLPQYDFEGDFDEFYACFVHGRLAYGDYFEHVLSWFEQRHLPNVLFLLYEDLLHDPVTQLLRLAAFLGTTLFAFSLSLFCISI